MLFVKVNLNKEVSFTSRQSSVIDFDKCAFFLEHIRCQLVFPFQWFDQ